MDAAQRATIRQIAAAATEAPEVGYEWREVYIATDDAHRKADVTFYMRARHYCLSLLDYIDWLHGEVERLQAERDRQDREFVTVENCLIDGILAKPG